MKADGVKAARDNDIVLNPIEGVRYTVPEPSMLTMWMSRSQSVSGGRCIQELLRQRLF